MPIITSAVNGAASAYPRTSILGVALTSVIKAAAERDIFRRTLVAAALMLLSLRRERILTRKID